jgi:hypothetical protein
MGVLGGTLQERQRGAPKKSRIVGWIDLAKLLELLIFQLEVPTPTSPHLDIGC